jgi:glycosyltransferase involved in cell wall biosynthesis/tetratricopeptide (TPR) repeat protein
MLNAKDELPAIAIEVGILLGRIDRCQDTTIIGWAAVADRVDQRLELDLLIDGEPVVRAIADLYRADVHAAGIGDGRSGFEIDVPPQYRDGVPHAVVVREVVTGLAINGSPIEFLVAPIPEPAPILEPISIIEVSKPRPSAKHIDGFVDDYEPAGVVGWAARRGGSSAPVEVELLVDGVSATRVIADVQRADLAGVGRGTGRHGFRLRLPSGIFDDKPHLIEVREVSTQESLERGSRVVRFNACDLWAAISDADLRRRWALADAALSFCENADDDALNESVHGNLLRMKEWLQTQPQSRSRRRVQNQLNRLTALRCRLVMQGLIDARRIGGTIVDMWAKDELLELEFVEDSSVAPDANLALTALTGIDGSFIFLIPDELLDDGIHRFHLRFKTLGGILGPWSFLLSSQVLRNGGGAVVRAEDPVWDTVPAAKALDTDDDIEVPLTAMELTRINLQDALDDIRPGVTNTVEIVRLRCELGNLLIEAGEFTEAMTEFEHAAKLDRDVVPSLVGQVKCLLARGEQSAAEARLAKGLKDFPEARELYSLDDEISGSKRMKQVRLVAFYLPQFHPTPENDAWWGKGFTEWTNVAAATPLFEGHLQPRRPTHLGFYDLRLPEAANAQFELARQYGIDGFCYYYYWFNGRRILERPLQDLAAGRTGPFPFCICWANEPWTRSWDGVTGDVLLAQNHTPESDLEFIKELAPLLRHKDYIRVDGKPVVMIYRAESLATPRETVALWRDWCRRDGIGELHLCAVQSFGFHDPRPLGFDAAVEFPPHCPATVYPDYDYHQIMEVKDRVEGFHAKTFSYQTFASGDMKTPREPFTLHRSAMVAWDNTARRQKAAHVFHDFSVATFERWVLVNARRAAAEQRDGMCFVNAWNEWAEGSVMEPDAHFGYEILEAARRAKRNANFDSGGTYWRMGVPLFPEDRLAQRERIIIVGHDAFRSGAQTNLLNMARTLKRDLDMEVILMLVDGGDLLEDYERVAPTYVIGREEGWRAALQKELRRYRPLGAHKAICNTCVTGELTEVFKQEGYRIVSLVHELPALIESYDLSARCWTLAANADNIVFASNLVAEEFCSRYWPESHKVTIAPQGIRFNNYHAERDSVRLQVREELGLPPASLLILGCGHGDTRKGIDLFVQVAAETRRQCGPHSVAFVWIGPVEWTLSPYILSDIKRLDLGDVFRVTGQTSDPARYFIAGDLFALTSREDPFPSVVMEAFDAKLPVVAFAGGGGYVDIVNARTGALVPYLDVPSMTNAVLDFIRNPDRRVSVGDYNHALCRERFGYEQYMRKLLALLSDVPAEQVTAGVVKRQPWFSDRARPTITAIVPNYNYARYLELRLRTIIEQTLPPDEIIVLDDASTDSSMELIQAIAKRSRIPISIVSNQKNSGNTFVQWATGLSKARGELVWIAEADDYCEPTLLETLARLFTDEKVVMAWTDSIMVDQSGASSGSQYKDYYSRNYGGRWYLNFRTEGRRLIDDYMIAENVIPNASAVLFRRKCVKKADLETMQQYRFSGDWWFWLSLALEGDVAYCATPLNYHRRHARSVMGEILRAGESLLPETMSFYTRVATQKPECISHHASVLAMTRLQQLFDMFPALRVSARIAEHPSLAAQYHQLIRELARAAGAKDRIRNSNVVLVLSHEVIDDDSSGSLLLRHLAAKNSLVNLLILAPESKATAFTESIRLPNLALTVIPPEEEPAASTKNTVDASAAKRRLHAALMELPGSCIMTHGLLAHCLVGSAPQKKGREWVMVAAKEFDAILGHPPTDPGVTIAALRAAITNCSILRHIGNTRPHAFARMAQTCSRPIDEFLFDDIRAPSCKVSNDEPAVHFVGIGLHASPHEWLELVRALCSIELSLPCKIRLRLLAWGSAIEDLRKTAADELRIEVINVFQRPNSLAQLGDILLAPSSTVQAHGPDLDFELQDSPMRLFDFASVYSASDDLLQSELRSHMTELIERRRDLWFEQKVTSLLH